MSPLHSRMLLRVPRRCAALNRPCVLNPGWHSTVICTPPEAVPSSSSNVCRVSQTHAL